MKGESESEDVIENVLEEEVRGRGRWESLRDWDISTFHWRLKS